ncbi:MAG: hypothetical protein ACLFQT_00765 [Thiohalophilus sp.]
MNDDAPHNENRQLRRKLKACEANAGRNAQKLRRFQNHKLRIIGVEAPHDLLTAVFSDRVFRNRTA